MHLLYLDDSGAVGNANEQYLVLGGVSVFETQSHWITQELDKLAETINPGDPHGVEFHASETFARPGRLGPRDADMDTNQRTPVDENVRL